MYLKEILDKIGDAINDTTLKSTGANASRTKAWVQQFYFLDLLPRVDWNFARKEGSFSTTSGTQRYNLPRWVDNPTRISNIILPTTYKALRQTTNPDVTGKYDLAVYNTPAEYVLGPRVRTNYSTGTITGTSASKTLTGTSTAWLTSGIEQFDYIQIGSYVYTVDTINSDTSITLFDDLNVSLSGASYTAVLDRWTIDLYPVPNATLSLAVHGKQIVPRLDDDADIPILPDNWHWILVKGGLVKALKHNSEDSTQESQELEVSIRRLVAEDQSEADRKSVV